MTFAQALNSLAGAPAALAQFRASADPGAAHDPGAMLTATSGPTGVVASACAAGATALADAAGAQDMTEAVNQCSDIWDQTTAQAAASLAAARGAWDQIRAAASPLLAASAPLYGPLSRIVTALQTFETSMHGLSGPTPPAPDRTDPRAVQDWLDQVTASMSGYAAAAAAATAYTAAPGAGAALTAWINDVTRLAADGPGIQAAVTTGPPPADPATLARYLDDVALLKTWAWPGPVGGHQRPAYQADIASYTAALDGLLAASTGLSNGGPAVLVPVRLETRLHTGAAGGYTLQVRIFPDDFAIDAHDPTLTALEASWAPVLQRAVAARSSDPAAAAATWDQAAAKFGAGRAAYLNAADLTDPAIMPAAGQPGRPCGPGRRPRRCCPTGGWPQPTAPMASCSPPG